MLETRRDLAANKLHEETNEDKIRQKLEDVFAAHLVGSQHITRIMNNCYSCWFIEEVFEQDWEEKKNK